MSTTAVRVEDIRPISHAEGMRLAETEYQRFADVIGLEEALTYLKKLQ